MPGVEPSAVEIADRVTDLIEAGQMTAATRLLVSLHPADQAEVLGDLDDSE